ncbi:MAG: DNA-3-methyladenine glycosylase 2 family protein [Pseudomonadota bacterium]
MDEREYDEAVHFLVNADPALKKAVGVIKRPVIRRRPGGYAGLFRIIVEQQLSIPSAQSILARCEKTLGEITPEQIVHTDTARLQSCGLSRPKIRYMKIVAEAVLAGTLDFTRLKKAEDNDAIAQLTAIKGIGPWSAAIYLLFCEGRMNIWPQKDVALYASYYAAKGESDKPAIQIFDKLATAQFDPYRGMAAHILWTHYAYLRNRVPI